MKLIATSYSVFFDKKLEKIEKELERCIILELDRMNVNQLEEVVKAGFTFKDDYWNTLTLNGITKDGSTYWFHFTDESFDLNDWNFTLDRLKLYPKKDLLTAIEKTL